MMNENKLFQKTEEEIEVAAKAKTKEVSMEEALWKSADNYYSRLQIDTVKLASLPKQL